MDRWLSTSVGDNNHAVFINYRKYALNHYNKCEFMEQTPSCVAAAQNDLHTMEIKMGQNGALEGCLNSTVQSVESVHNNDSTIVLHHVQNFIC